MIGSRLFLFTYCIPNYVLNILDDPLPTFNFHPECNKRAVMEDDEDKIISSGMDNTDVGRVISSTAMWRDVQAKVTPPGSPAVLAFPPPVVIKMPEE